MTFAAILAGGIGSRMGNSETPKQFLMLGDKPVIVHTIEKFLAYEGFEHIVVVTPKDWVEHTNNLIEKYDCASKNISVLEGGSTRNETLMNAISFIEDKFGLTDETIIVTHDAVRPFVTKRMIAENIGAAKRFGACDTVIPATDTVVESKDGKIISQIPNRAELFQSQTPQSFNALKLKTFYESLTFKEKEILTDACKIFALKGENVYLVDGDTTNIKITYPFDLEIAKTILECGGKL